MPTTTTTTISPEQVDTSGMVCPECHRQTVVCLNFTTVWVCESTYRCESCGHEWTITA